MTDISTAWSDKNARVFPIRLEIDGEPFLHYKSLRIDKNLDNFVDGFEIQMNNPWGRYSKSLPVWAVVEVFYLDTLIFRWIAERKVTSYQEVGSTLVLSGREELLVMTEDDADPRMWPYKWVTDNSIIQEIVQGYNWDLELGEGKIIKEYAIPWGSTRKGQILSDIVNYNEFVLIKRGNTIFKEPIPDWFRQPVEAKFVMTILDGQFHIENTRILSVTISEDVTSVRSKIVGFTYQKGKKKLQQVAEQNIPNLQDWRYASKMRNRTTLRGYKLNRTHYMTTPAKDAWELDNQVRKQAMWLDMKDDIQVVVYGFQELQLLDTVDVQLEQEWIVQYLYVKGISYSLDQSNKLTTTFTLTRFRLYE